MLPPAGGNQCSPEPGSPDSDAQQPDIQRNDDKGASWLWAAEVRQSAVSAVRVAKVAMLGYRMEKRSFRGSSAASWQQARY
ncbi:hypothetical protein C1O66_01635 [Paucibacter aquatile]|uniref:Uncharacterized protein n=1 Tax=Kinneretia aquatilis TaxID=2070761 RepID=A0A2N8L336_9BURK|nr:hypothetical protein C1O66_01635 [Paucibacter aquatile]